MSSHEPRGSAEVEDSTSSSPEASLGSVASLWRYPVKSMMGEELNAAALTKGGLLGDRAYAIVDSSDGKVATAKNPRKWPTLFGFHAELADVAQSGSQSPPVHITLPGGETLDSDQPDASAILSRALEREVTLSTVSEQGTGTSEEYWPDMEGLEHRDTVTDFGLPEGTFFDCASVHLLTTGTLDRLRQLYPEGRFEIRRFRPNIVVKTGNGEGEFPENAWVGRVLAIGDAVRLHVTGSCPRCVMTTLPQGDLPRDLGILRTAAQHNGAHVGVYASVMQGGQVNRGDAVRLV